MSAERLAERQEEIKSLSEQGYRVREMDGGYCYRINQVYDLYPVNNKWHHIPTGKRGTAQNLKKFLLQALSIDPTQKPEQEKKKQYFKPSIPEPENPEDRDILTGKICWYCGKPTELVSSTKVYGKDYGLIYLCEPCDAYVGVHENTTIGKGRVADAELREWKKRAHAKFDKIWIEKMRRDNCSKKNARDFAYRWLSDQMGMAFGQCHIGWMKIEECQRVVEVCNNNSLSKIINKKSDLPIADSSANNIDDSPFEV